MSKKMTERNTKKEILEAYEEARKQIESTQSKVFDPVKEAKSKVENEVINKTDSADVDKLEQILGGLKQEFYTFSEQLSNYKDISDAIKIKQIELKEMFDIEKSAYTLSALVNSNEKIRVDFDEEMKIKKEELADLVNTTESNMADFRRKVESELRDLETQAKKQREREESEWEYSFERRKTRDLDSMRDEAKRINRELDDRQSDLESREEKVEELENTVKELKEIMEVKISEAETRGKEKANKSNAFEVRALKKENEYQANRANDKIEHLESVISSQSEENKELKQKLDAAYAKLETLASKTVESANRNPVFAPFDNGHTNTSIK